MTNNHQAMNRDQLWARKHELDREKIEQDRAWAAETLLIYEYMDLLAGRGPTTTVFEVTGRPAGSMN